MFLFLLSLVGCAQVDQKQVMVGLDGMDYQSGMQVIFELVDEEIFLLVKNPNTVAYQVWIVYKLNSKVKNYRMEERIYEGKDQDKYFIAQIPNDNDHTSRESVKVYVTSVEELDVDKIVNSAQRALRIRGGTTLGGTMVVHGYPDIRTRIKYFETPEVVLNSFRAEGSYGNSLEEEFE